MKLHFLHARPFGGKGAKPRGGAMESNRGGHHSEPDDDDDVIRQWC